MFRVPKKIFVGVYKYIVNRSIGVQNNICEISFYLKKPGLLFIMSLMGNKYKIRENTFFNQLMVKILTCHER